MFLRTIFNLKRNIITDAKVEEERDGESDDQFQEVESHVAFNYQTTEEQLSPVLQWMVNQIVDARSRAKRKISKQEETPKTMKGKAIKSSNVIKSSSDTTFYTPGIQHANRARRKKSDITERFLILWKQAFRVYAAIYCCVNPHKFHRYQYRIHGGQGAMTRPLRSCLVLLFCTFGTK